jgi:hypothetical protein
MRRAVIVESNWLPSEIGQKLPRFMEERLFGGSLLSINVLLIAVLVMEFFRYRQTVPTVSLSLKFNTPPASEWCVRVDDTTIAACYAVEHAIDWVRGTPSSPGVLPWRGNHWVDVFYSGGAAKLAVELARNQTDLFDTRDLEFADLLNAVSLAGSGNCKEHATATTVHLGAHFEKMPIFKVHCNDPAHAFTVVGDWRVSNASIVADTWVDRPIPHAVKHGLFSVDGVDQQYAPGPRPQLKEMFEEIQKSKRQYEISPTESGKIFADEKISVSHFMVEAVRKDAAAAYLFFEPLSSKFPDMFFQSETQQVTFDHFPKAQHEEMSRRVRHAAGGKKALTVFDADRVEAALSLSLQDLIESRPNFEATDFAKTVRAQLNAQTGGDLALDLTQFSRRFLKGLPKRVMDAVYFSAYFRGITITEYKTKFREGEQKPDWMTPETLLGM